MRSIPPLYRYTGVSAGIVAVLLCGCQPLVDQPTESTSGSALQEQAASASQSLGLLLDSATEATLGAIAVPGARITGGEHAPDLTQLNGTRSYDLATLTTNGQPLFSSVTTAGIITVTHVGTAVTSSPMGSTTMYTGTVAVALSAVVITNGNGDTLRIPTGTFTYAMAAICTTSDATNWVFDQRTSVAIDPAFSATVTHGDRAYNLTLGGNRTLHQVITREYSGGGVVNRRIVLREISGTSDGRGLSSDPLIGGHLYAGWRVAVQGIPVTWNRYATVTTTTDFTLPVGSMPTVTSSEDRTFITVLNLVEGPKTASQWSALLGARLQAEFL